MTRHGWWVCSERQSKIWKRGLSFIREVEKGSHVKADAVLRFRPEAIKALCQLCCARIADLTAEARQEDGGNAADGEVENGQVEGVREEQQMEADAGPEGTTGMAPKRRLALDTDAFTGSMGIVYRRIEPPFKTKLQLLVHQHKMKGRSK